MIVVFDLDGTLIDSVQDIALSANELVVSLGGEPVALDRIPKMIGDGAALLVRRALEASGLEPNTPDALSAFLHIYDRRLLDNTVAYDGVGEMLSLLSTEATLAVLTNKPLAHSERVLTGVGLRHFFATVIGGDGPFRKPDPAGLLSLSGGRRARTLMVGDSPIDWSTAKAAACPFVWARYGFGRDRFEEELPQTPYVIDRPIALVDVVRTFAKRLAAVDQHL
jgi:phosphoglycolate phosphatase